MAFDGVVSIQGASFRVYDVPRDGSCLFSAFSYGLVDSTSFASQLRVEAVREMRDLWHELGIDTNAGSFSPYPSYDAYVTDMMRDDTYAGPTEIEVLARMYNCKVRVFQGAHLFDIHNPAGFEKIDLLFIREGVHYKCLKEITHEPTQRDRRRRNSVTEDVRIPFPETNYDLRGPLRNDNEPVPDDIDDLFDNDLPTSFPFGSNRVRTMDVDELPAFVDRRSSLALKDTIGKHYMWAAVYRGEKVHGTKEVTLGDMTVKCPTVECGAVFYKAERLVAKDEVPAWCCGKTIKCILKPGARFQPIMDPAVLELYTGTSEQAIDFQENIREYNHALSCAVPIANYDHRQLYDGQIVCVNGRLTFECETSFSSNLNDGQLYFAEMTRSVIDERLLRSETKLRSDVLTILERYLRQHNDLVRTFATAAELQRAHPTQMVSLLINPHRDGFRVTDRDYLDTDPECMRPIGSKFVAAAFVGERINYKYDVALFPKGSRNKPIPCKTIHEASPSLDALLYPLIHLHSEDPWVEIVEERRRIERPPALISAAACGTLRDYYSSRVMIRPDQEEGVLFRSRALFQQWLCDAAAKIEDNNLNYAEANQEQLTVCQLDSLKRFVAEEADVMGKKPGRIVIVPGNIQTSERAMRNNYMDSVTISCHKGPPTFLWTFTTNPKWPEIVEGLRKRGLRDDEYYNAPDLVVRSYLPRLLNALGDIIYRGIYGRVLGYSGVHEFQTTGLPHFHLAVILDPADVPQTPDDIDAFVCAEIPSIETETDVHYYVMKHMIHKPCDGSCPDYPNPSCRPNGSPCKAGFPFPHRNETVVTRKGPLLRRRKIAPVWSIKFKCFVDNRWVVPFPPRQGVKCQCHINIMISGPNLCYKYMYGYFTKESRGQCVQGGMLKFFRENATGPEMHWDEIKHFQELRVINPYEAMFKILGVPIARLSHSVVSLPVHLPGRQYVYYRGDYHMAAELPGTSKLEGWFELNKNYPSANHFLYSEIVSNYKWQKGAWVKKKEPTSTLGRLMHVNPSPRNMELFYLRLLLLNRTGMTSFKDLLTVDGVQYDTFGKACKALGISDAEQVDYEEAIAEIVSHASPFHIRIFFATIVATGLLQDPETLWVQYRHQMSMDFIRRGCGLREAYIRCRREILLKVGELCEGGCQIMQPDPDDSIHVVDNPGFDFMVPVEDFTDVSEPGVEEGFPGEEEYEEPLDCPEPSNRDAIDDDDAQPHFDLLRHCQKYTEEQRSVHQTIMEAIIKDDRDQCNLFSLIAPAGCGKTYVYQGILMECKLKKIPFVSCAMTALASLLLLDADTCHKTFGIPVRARQDGTQRSFLERTSPEAIRICNSKLIVIDEVSMLAKWQVILIDEFLRDISSRPHIPFGGRVVLLGGDMGQILPVLRNASRSELIANALPAWEHWGERKELSLTKNLRASDDPEFAEWVSKVRDGSQNLSGGDDIRIDIEKLVVVKRDEECDATSARRSNAVTDDEYNTGLALVEQIYVDYRLQTLQEAIVLSPINDSTRLINNIAVQRMPDDVAKKLYLGNTTIILEDRGTNRGDNFGDFIMTTEELENIQAANLPPHRLELKVGCVVMLLINLNKRAGLCNGARFVVEKLFNHAICLRRLMPFNGKRDLLYLPKMRMRSDDVPVVGSIQRFQFPINLAFAVTINKSQGQTFETVGLFLPRPVFSHGQFYVAVGRARGAKKLKIAVMRGPQQGPYNPHIGGKTASLDVRTKNLVWREVL